MANSKELNQVIYQVIVTQIRFGAYPFGASLPTMELASQLLLVSVDTVRAAYLRLKKEGYITLTKNVGATVRVQYSPQDIEQHIQAFFAPRKEAMIDLCQSLLPIFKNVQWFAFRRLSPEELDRLEERTEQLEILPPFRMIQHLQLIYRGVKNDLLMRLIWQTFMFLQAPFFSVSENLQKFKLEGSLSRMLHLCRQQDWTGLQQVVETFLQQLTAALLQFYETRVSTMPCETPISFSWSAYKKSAQQCYSLGRKLLFEISHNFYAAGCLLPSLEKLAQKKHVSVSTVHRTLKLLNQIGAVRTENGVGTRVLPLEHSAENCDFTNPVVRARLLDLVQCLQICAVSCRECAECTVAAMDALTIQACMVYLSYVKQMGQLESVVYVALDIIGRFSPLQAMRTIYAELRSLIFWGYPLRNMHGDWDAIYSLYLPYQEAFLDCLAQHDAKRFARKFEELFIMETTFCSNCLMRLGFSEVADLLLFHQN